jgi:hypothetical protein
MRIHRRIWSTFCLDRVWAGLPAAVGDVRKATYHFAFALGALRWGVHGSHFFDAMDASWFLVHFSCTRVFLLRFCNKFGCVWSSRDFGCVRYRRGRNIIPLSNKCKWNLTCKIDDQYTQWGPAVGAVQKDLNCTMEDQQDSEFTSVSPKGTLSPWCFLRYTVRPNGRKVVLSVFLYR